MTGEEEDRRRAMREETIRRDVRHRLKVARVKAGVRGVESPWSSPELLRAAEDAAVTRLLLDAPRA